MSLTPWRLYFWVCDVIDSIIVEIGNAILILFESINQWKEPMVLRAPA